nr:MAG TPA: hypothetical protein [Caudoviricetes sp.]
MTPCRAEDSCSTSHLSLLPTKSGSKPGYKPKPKGGED